MILKKSIILLVFICLSKMANCQMMVGNVYETPMFLASGYIPYYGKEHIQVFGSYGFQKGGYPRYGGIGVRYTRPIPWLRHAHIAFGGYMQDYNLGNNFFGLKNKGVNFAISSPLINNKTLILIGAGAFSQTWNANWNLFKPFGYFDVRYGIQSFQQIEPFRDLKEHTAGDVSVSWNIQQAISSQISISYGVEGKNLARHSLFPGTTSDQYRSPVDLSYYIKGSWGREFGTEETNKNVSFDLFAAVNVVSKDFVNIFYPVVKSPDVLSAGQLIGAGAHFNIAPEYFLYASVASLGDLNPLSPVDTIGQYPDLVGITIRLDHLTEDALWSLGVGYYTSAPHPGPKSNMFNVNLSLMIFHPREGIPIKCITKPFVKAKLKFRRKRY